MHRGAVVSRDPSRDRILVVRAVGIALACVLARPVVADPTLGSWGAVQALPWRPVHSVLLPTGKVLIYANTDVYTWDPVSETLTDTNDHGYNAFCGGHTLLADGRVFFTGGHIPGCNGLPNATYYDPWTDTFTPVPNMAGGRWYPSMVTLGNGDVVTMSGKLEDGSKNLIPEVWEVDAGAWRPLTTASLNLPLFPAAFLAPNGQVFLATSTSRFLDTSGTGTWTTGPTRLHSGRDNYGSACLYDVGKVLFAGGADAPTATCEVIDLNAPTPTWTAVASMPQVRRQHDVTILPDGRVLVIGGSSASGFNTEDGPKPAIVWDPASDAWTTWAMEAEYRGYHSEVVLLPDARVASIGGDGHPSLQVFSPPYLFQGPRPTISSAPVSVALGGTFFVETPDAAAIGAVNWLRPTAATHTQNMNQRINKLVFQPAPGGLNVTVPASANECPPGDYMLFLIDTNGVPSVAAWIVATEATAQQPPPTPTGLAATAGDAQAILSWNAATDATGYNVKRSTTSGGPYTIVAAGIPSTTYTDTNLTNGVTYFYVVSAVNAAGESGDSSEVGATPSLQPPGAPTDLEAIGNNGQVDLVWSAPTGTVDSYNVKRATTSGGPYGAIASGVGTTSYADTTVSNGVTYFYVVSAENTAGESPDSTEDDATPNAPPTPPANLSASPGSTQVLLTWNVSPLADSYNVYRATTPGGPYSGIAFTWPDTTFLDTGLSDGTPYFYVVTGVNDAGESEFSTEAAATPSGATAKLASGVVSGVGSDWQTVTLARSYDSMVVVASPNYGAGDLPAVARVRNAAGSQFDVKVQNPSGAALSGYTVHYVAIEEGVYTAAVDGVTMEAVKLTSTITDRNGSWVGENAVYQNGYLSPVVLGQVMTEADVDWSVFWASDGNAGNPPTAASFRVGKHVGEDSDTDRANETLGVLVLEAGSGVVEGIPFVAALGADSILGYDDSPPYSYAHGGPSDARAAVVSSAGMDGSNGGFPILYGSPALTSSSLDLAIDEDQIRDSERVHISEQVAYLVLGEQTLPPGIPSNLSAVGGTNRIDLTWSSAERADGYNVKRGTTPGGPYTTIASGITSNSFADTGLAGGATFYYVVSAVNTAGESADSGEATGTTTSPPVIHSFVGTANPAPVLSDVTFTLSASDADLDPLQYSFDFGDGSPATAFSPSTSAMHSYPAPGRYTVTGYVTDATSTVFTTLVQVIHLPLPAARPTVSTQILYDAGRGKIWNVNPDSDTVTRTGTSNLTKDFEVSVGAEPRSLTLRPDGSEIWVASEGADQLCVLDPQTGAVLAKLATPRGSRPMNVVFSPNGLTVYVTYMASGELARWDPAARTETGRVNLGSTPRAIAISSDSTRIFVGRFVSGPLEGEVREVDAASLTVTRAISLAHDTTPDSESSGRGTPNYLIQMAITPDEQRLWIPSKKDNTDRGLFRDGLVLTHDSTVRSIVSQVDLGANSEDLAARIDVDDHEIPYGVDFSPVGDLAFVAYQGNNSVRVFDRYEGTSIAEISLGAELAPQGLVVTPDGSRLFVMNFMSRSVSAFDIAGLVNGTRTDATELAVVSTVATELLPPDVLLGKQVFYNAADTRMTAAGYISCATCHLDGGQDGRVFDFTDRGEGLRNTVDLRGRSGTGHGNVHWTANFDEIQDFEHDIRGPFAGTGFINGPVNASLGAPNAGRSVELDALAAYVASLDSVGRSPYRMEDGSLSADGVAGRLIFQDLECAGCHSGTNFSDSNVATSGHVLHDVGTITAGSGERLGGPLTGLDTPTLRGLWDGGPYLHDGSAPTLLDVLTTANPIDQHGATSGLSAVELDQLVAYLLQIDDASDAAVPVRPTNVQAVGGNGVVLLDWDDVPGADSYSIRSSTVSGGPYGLVASGIVDSSFADSSVVNGNTYYYVVSADNAGGQGFDSDEVNATPGAIFAKLATGVIHDVGSDWVMVDLGQSYSSMVVVCTVAATPGQLPAVPRVRNASGSQFELKVQNPSGAVLSGYTVHSVAVEEGTYTTAAHGFTMEAVKRASTRTDSYQSWLPQPSSYLNAYANPVVIGQVMTENDAAWSAFWANDGSNRRNPPTGGGFGVGLHVGEDSNAARASETLGYIVLEAGAGSIDGISFVARLGSDIVRGVDNSPPYSYSVSGLSNPSVAIVSSAAMDGGNGGWPALYGTNPVGSTLDLAIYEDQIRDSEQRHGTEQVAYVIFE